MSRIVKKVLSNREAIDEMQSGRDEILEKEKAIRITVENMNNALITVKSIEDVRKFVH